MHSISWGWGCPKIVHHSDPISLLISTFGIHLEPGCKSQGQIIHYRSAKNVQKQATVFLHFRQVLITWPRGYFCSLTSVTSWGRPTCLDKEYARHHKASSSAVKSKWTWPHPGELKCRAKTVLLVQGNRMTFAEGNICIFSTFSGQPAFSLWVPFRCRIFIFQKFTDSSWTVHEQFLYYRTEHDLGPCKFRVGRLAFWLASLLMFYV